MGWRAVVKDLGVEIHPAELGGEWAGSGYR